MELTIRSKDDYPIIAIFSEILYLHKDEFIRSGITDVNLDLGYWTSKEDAENLYSEWKDRNLKIEILL